jgi:hypothetical protein
VQQLGLPVNVEVAMRPGRVDNINAQPITTPLPRILPQWISRAFRDDLHRMFLVS